MSHRDSSGSLIAQFALLAGIYLMLQGIVNMIAVSRNPGRVSTVGIIGAIIFYVFALCLHVTHEGDPEFCIMGGHIFAFVYCIAIFVALIERIGHWLR